MSTPPIETERKFLIAYPDISALRIYAGVRIKEIEQTYLTSDSKTNKRIRKITENGKTYYIKTEKSRISLLSCYEQEDEIDEIMYRELLTQRDCDKQTIKKIRYCLPLGDSFGHIMEIDIYPFWCDRAILEVELEDENEQLSLPAFIKVIKEVSSDSRYKNTNLAKEIPYDDIGE